MKEFENVCKKVIRESDARDKQLALQFKMTMTVVGIGLISIVYLIIN